MTAWKDIPPLGEARGFDPRRFLTSDGKSFLASNQMGAVHLLLNAISDGVIGADAQDHIVYSNSSARQQLGFSQEELKSRKLSTLIHREDNAWGELMKEVRRGEIIATDQYTIENRNGLRLRMIFTLIPILSSNHSFDGLLLVFRDIVPGLLASLPLEEREKLLHGMFETMPAGVILEKENGRLVRVNQKIEEMIGQSDAELRGRPFPVEAWDARDRMGRPVPIQDAPFEIVRTTGALRSERILLLKDRCYMVSAQSFVTHSGNAVSRLIVTTFTDIDDPFRNHAELEDTIGLNNEINRLLTELLTEHGASRTIRTAIAGVSELLNADFTTIGIYEPEDGTFLFAYFWSDTGSPEISTFRVDAADVPVDKEEQEGSTNLQDWLITEADKHIRVLERLPIEGGKTLCAPIYSEGEIRGVIYVHRQMDRAFPPEAGVSMQSITPVLSAAILKAGYERRLKELATTDSLTGLVNRRVLFTNLEKETERSRRYNNPMSVIMLDLDHFKDINDNFGHIVGDEVLMEVARVMQLRTRSSDLVARTGGEEFMILLPATGLDGAVITAEKLREDIAGIEIQADTKVVRVTASMGVAEYDRSGSMLDFYAGLDRLLYQSKENGRNRVSH